MASLDFPSRSSPDIFDLFAVCRNDIIRDGEFDERLTWSEYNFHLWCYICKRDYPSCLCLPDIDSAIESLDAYLHNLSSSKN